MSTSAIANADSISSRTGNHSRDLSPGSQKSFQPNVVNIDGRRRRRHWAYRWGSLLGWVKVDLKREFLDGVLDQRAGTEVQHNLMPSPIVPRTGRGGIYVVGAVGVLRKELDIVDVAGDVCGVVE